MTATQVDAAVAAIERRDPSLGDWARVAADGMTAGEGAEILTQAGVQDFLWYRLPAKYPKRSGPVRRQWIDGHPTGPNVTSRTAAGRSAALEYLHGRATATRTSLHT